MTRLALAGLQRQQVRTLKRKLAYPQAYKMEVVPLTHKKKDHSSLFQRHMKAWLGPVNARGEYYRNKYYYPPQNHKPNYIVSDGQLVVDTSREAPETRRFGNSKRNPALHPFPQNEFCKTASMVSSNLKDKIAAEVQGGAHSQEVAHKYGIKIPRVEAVVKLHAIEQQWKEKVRFFMGTLMR